MMISSSKLPINKLCISYTYNLVTFLKMESYESFSLERKAKQVMMKSYGDKFFHRKFTHISCAYNFVTF